MTVAERTSFSLPESIIDRCGQRAADYDCENRFFDEYFEELKQAGYLLLNVPTEFGGHGLSLAETCQEQRRRPMLAWISLGEIARHRRP